MDRKQKRIRRSPAIIPPEPESLPPAEPSQAERIAESRAVRHAFGMAELRAAIARWEEARAREDEAHRLDRVAMDLTGYRIDDVARSEYRDGAPKRDVYLEVCRWDVWTSIAGRSRIQEDETITRWVLALNGVEEAQDPRVLHRYLAPCAVAVDGRIYIAAPGHDDDPDEPADKVQEHRVMQLTVVDLDRVIRG